MGLLSIIPILRYNRSVMYSDFVPGQPLAVADPPPRPRLSGLRTLPIFFIRPLRIFRDYRLADLRPDLLAGLTVALVVLPQAIAYALVAGLPPQTGLYAAIAGAIAGALWGSSNQLHTGPTNAASLLVLSVLLAVAAHGEPEYLAAAGLLAILVGVFRLAMGLARLGMLVNFVSDSVIVGFTAGAGVLIGANQTRNLLRLPIPSRPELLDTVDDALAHLGQAHWPSLACGLGTMAIIWAVQRLNRTRRAGRLPLPGPLIALVAASAVVAALGPATAVKVIGQIPHGLPPLAHLPVTDWQLVGKLSTGALAIAAIGLVEAMSIARSMAGQTQQRLDSNQEFVGQGLANIASALVSGYTCSGSFTRSAVNLKAGGRTALSSVFSGLFTLLAMLVFAPLAAAIPLSALAGVLVITAIGLIDRREMASIWRSRGADRTIMVVTLLATLFLPLQFAVLTGILMSLAFHILETSTPRVRTVLPDDRFEHFIYQPGKPACPQLGIIEILGDLYFGAVHHVEECIERNLAENPSQRFLLLRMQSVEHCDISGIHALEHVVRAYRERGGDVFLSRVRGPAFLVMEASGFYERLGADHFLPQDAAVSHLFHKVLDPAVCIYECPLAAFRECQNLPKRLPEAGPAERMALPALWHHAGQPDGGPLADVRSITPRDLRQALRSADPPLVLDVREPREFRRGHIAEARLTPLPTLLRWLENQTSGVADRDDQLAALSRDARLVFVCRGGRRSSRVAALFQARGYQNVMTLQGGMLAWEAEALLEAVDEIA